MGDDEQCCARRIGIAADRGEDGAFAAAIHSAGRLIKQQHGGPADKAAGQRDRLPLAAGKSLTALAKNSVNALRQAGHPIRRASEADRLKQFLIGSERPVDGEILADAAGEQQRVLRHQADAPAQQRRIDVGGGDPVDEKHARPGA